MNRSTTLLQDATDTAGHTFSVATAPHHSGDFAASFSATVGGNTFRITEYGRTRGRALRKARRTHGCLSLPTSK